MWFRKSVSCPNLLTIKNFNLALIAVGLAHISHQFSHFGVLDVLSSTTPRPSDRKPHWARHLADLATKAGEKSGLAVSAGEAADRSPMTLLPGGGGAQALAAGDFDEDGVVDLVVGVETATGCILVLWRGNVDAVYPNTLEAKEKRPAGKGTDSAFLSPARVGATPRSCRRRGLAPPRYVRIASRRGISTPTVIWICWRPRSVTMHSTCIWVTAVVD